MSGYNPLRAKPVQAVGEPKQMSSRLLTMKFMQRAANSNSRSQPPTTPSSEPSAKRQKIDATPTSSNVTTPDSEYKSFADRTAIQAALKAEANTEAAARARHMLDGGETQWILHVDLPPQTQVGEGEMTSEDEIDWVSPGGRQTYGPFKRRKKVEQVGKPSSSQNDHNLSVSSDSGDESSDSGLSSRSQDDETTDAPTVGQSNFKHKAGLTDEDLDKIDLSKSSYARSKGTLLGSAGKGRHNPDGPRKNRHRSGKTPINMNTKDLQKMRNAVRDRGQDKQARRKRKTM